VKKVADGSVFLGSEALELSLVDQVMTSSEYILERVQAGDRVLKLHRSNPARFLRRPIISPIDVLPHLRMWIATNILGVSAAGNPQLEQTPIDGATLMSWLVQAGSLLGFVHHLYSQYLRNAIDR